MICRGLTYHARTHARTYTNTRAGFPLLMPCAGHQGMFNALPRGLLCGIAGPRCQPKIRTPQGQCQRASRTRWRAAAQEVQGDIKVRGDFKVHYRIFTPGGTELLQQSAMGFQQHMQEKSSLSSHLSTTPPRVFHVLTDRPTLLRPTAEGATPRLPIVVLHGGPGVPSDYLLPLSALASDKRSPRAVYFYDQLGCGLSDEPKDFSFYSPSQAITSQFSFSLIPRRPLDRLLRCFFSSSRARYVDISSSRYRLFFRPQRTARRSCSISRSTMA